MSASGRVLLVGGSSEIGLAIVESILEPGGQAVLAGRPSERLDAGVAHLRANGHDTSTLSYDAHWGSTQTETLLDDAWHVWGSFDTVVLSVGTMGQELPQPVAGTGSAASRVRERDLEEMLAVNLVGPALVLDGCAARLAAQGHGTVVVVSSVAAVRPRESILAYAAAKQALDTLARGADRRLRAHGGRCLVIRPGRVSTRMTAGLAKAPLTQDAAQVGLRVRQALGGGARVAWSPRVIAPLTTALRWTPDAALPRSLR